MTRSRTLHLPVRPLGPHGRRAAAAAVLLVLTALASGCFNPFKPTLGDRLGRYQPPPERDTPTGVVKLLEWAYNRRDYQVYKTLFTEDYQFYFDPNDSAGNSYRSDPWIRSYELQSAQNLFEGGSATEPPATAIDCSFNPVLFAQDTGDTLDQTTHRRVSTAVTLTITTSSGSSYQVQGNVDFYVVHHKVAKVPPDIASRLNPNDWLIYAWVDRTLATGGGGLTSPPVGEARAGPGLARAAPAAAAVPHTGSWGAVKAAYR